MNPNKWELGTKIGKKGLKESVDQDYADFKRRNLTSSSPIDISELERSHQEFGKWIDAQDEGQISETDFRNQYSQAYRRKPSGTEEFMAKLQSGTAKSEPYNTDNRSDAYGATKIPENSKTVKQ